MTNKRLVWWVWAWPGLVLSVVMIIMALPAFVRAEGPEGAIVKGVNPIFFSASSPPAGVGGSETAPGVLAGAVCPANIIAYWKLDEAGGPPYADFLGGADAVCAGTCPTALTKGRVNGAQTFNGLDTGLNAPAIPAFNWGQADSFSIEFWVKGVPDETCAGLKNEVIIGRDDSTTNLHWWLGCNVGSGQARFRLDDTDGGSDFSDLQGGPSIVDGAWHHVAGVRDGANSINRLYVDGQQVASKFSALYSTGFDSALAALNIGWLNLTSGFHFKGDIDEVAIYSRTLSSSEIAAHYNNGIPGPGYCGGPFAPTIISPAPAFQVLDAGQLFTYDVEAVGQPSPAYTLTMAPTGMTIDPGSGLISWTPTISQEGIFTNEVEASNSQGVDTQIFIIGAGAFPPQITSEPPLKADIGVFYAYQIEAVGNPPPTYTLVIRPQGMKINQNTGRVTWTPSPAQLGFNAVLIKASNTKGTWFQGFDILALYRRYLPAIIK